VQAMATVVAIGVTTEGERQVLGVDAGPSEDGPFWTAFLRNLLATMPHSARELVAAIVRTIFAQPDRATAMAQLHSTNPDYCPHFLAGPAAAFAGSSFALHSLAFSGLPQAS